MGGLHQPKLRSYMLGFRKKPQPIKKSTENRVYCQVAVTPKAHAKLRKIADKTNSSIIDTVDNLVGV